LKACDQTPTNAHTIAYDEHNPFVICAASFTPIYKGSPLVRRASVLLFFFPFLRRPNSISFVC
jgi:coatomer protein complex subunit alpha (xenin)